MNGPLKTISRRGRGGAGLRVGAALWRSRIPLAGVAGWLVFPIGRAEADPGDVLSAGMSDFFSATLSFIGIFLLFVLGPILIISLFAKAGDDPDDRESGPPQQRG